MVEKNIDDAPSCETKKKTFAEKFGLQGRGVPVHISPETKAIVDSLLVQGAAIKAAGEAYAATEKRKFGGTPAPGEPGSERYFTLLSRPAGPQNG